MARIEADENAWIEGDRIISQRRRYWLEGGGYDVITTEVYWDPVRMEYVGKPR